MLAKAYQKNVSVTIADSIELVKQICNLQNGYYQTTTRP